MEYFKNEGKDFPVPKEKQTVVLDNRFNRKSTSDFKDPTELFKQNAHTGIPGKWNDSLMRFVTHEARKGTPFEEVMAIYRSHAQNQNDPIDLAVIKHAYKHGVENGLYKNSNDIKDLLISTTGQYIIENMFRFFLDGTIRKNGKIYNEKDLSDEIFIYAKNKGIKNTSKQVIDSFLNLWKKDQREILLEDLRQHIAYKGDSDDLREFVTAVNGEENELDIKSLEQFIWQVKRKLFNRKVDRHLMVIIYGKTGSGKSVAIRKLLAPIKDLAIEHDLSVLKDERCIFMLTENLVIFFDEMAKADKVDVNSLKYKITSEYLTYRPMRTNSQVKAANFCTFIGASNNSVRDTIFDPTSARRYYEIQSADKCDWETINNIDYLKIWRSVDESQDTPPIESMLDELAEAQEGIRSKDSVEEWLEVEELLPGDGETISVTVKELYESYSTWMDSQSRSRFKLSVRKFGSLMTQYLGKSKSSRGARVYALDKQGWVGHD